MLYKIGKEGILNGYLNDNVRMIAFFSSFLNNFIWRKSRVSFFVDETIPQKTRMVGIKWYFPTYDKSPLRFW